MSRLAILMSLLLVPTMASAKDLRKRVGVGYQNQLSEIPSISVTGRGVRQQGQAVEHDASEYLREQEDRGQCQRPPSARSLPDSGTA